MKLGAVQTQQQSGQISNLEKQKFCNLIKKSKALVIRFKIEGEGLKAKVFGSFHWQLCFKFHYRLILYYLHQSNSAKTHNTSILNSNLRAKSQFSFLSVLNKENWQKLFSLRSQRAKLKLDLNSLGGWNISSMKAVLLSCVVFGHMWHFPGLKVSILGAQSPKYQRVKGLQTGSFKGSWLLNVHI